MAIVERSPLPGGYGRSSLVVGPTSPALARGEGWEVVDTAGNSLIDANNNFTTLVHGHGHPGVLAASMRAVTDGVCFGAPTEYEAAHATALCSRLGWADSVRYANSGTEAVMTALRVARAHTGRDAVIVAAGAYHGMADAVVVAGGPRSARGVAEGVTHDTLQIPFNDVEALSRAIEHHGERVAAVVIDLLPNRAGLIASTVEFIAAARRVCDASGALLIIDEVVSFRLGVGGLAPRYDVRPDLVVLGKLIGGGFPIGAVAGGHDIMGELDPLRPDGLEHGGTFTANPVSMRAGLAALEALDEAQIGRVNRLGALARASLADAAQAHGWDIRGRGSLLRLVPTDCGEPAHLQRELWWAAYREGVLLMPTGLMALSTAMDETVVEELVERVRRALAHRMTKRPS